MNTIRVLLLTCFSISLSAQENLPYFPVPEIISVEFNFKSKGNQLLPLTPEGAVTDLFGKILPGQKAWLEWLEGSGELALFITPSKSETPIKHIILKTPPGFIASSPLPELDRVPAVYFLTKSVIEKVRKTVNAHTTTIEARRSLISTPTPLPEERAPYKEVVNEKKEDIRAHFGGAMDYSFPFSPYPMPDISIQADESTGELSASLNFDDGHILKIQPAPTPTTATYQSTLTSEWARQRSNTKTESSAAAISTSGSATQSSSLNQPASTPTVKTAAATAISNEEGGSHPLPEVSNNNPKPRHGYGIWVTAPKGVSPLRALFDLKNLQVKELPAGTSAKIYKISQSGGKEFVIKRIKVGEEIKGNDPEVNRHFCERGGEATALEFKDHPNIVKTFSLIVGHSITNDYTVINHPRQLPDSWRKLKLVAVLEEFVDGMDVLDCFYEGYLTAGIDTALRAAIHIGRALVHLQENHFIHRDLKAENIMYDFQKKIFKLIDFGYCMKLNPGDLTKTICGTRYCMAPELFPGQGYGHHADTWGLGSLLIQFLVQDTIAQFASGGPVHIDALNDDSIRENINFFSKLDYEAKKQYLILYFRDIFHGNEKLIELIHQLTRHSPQERIPLQEAVSKLETMQSERDDINENRHWSEPGNRIALLPTMELTSEPPMNIPSSSINNSGEHFSDLGSPDNPPADNPSSDGQPGNSPGCGVKDVPVTKRIPIPLQPYPNELPDLPAPNSPTTPELMPLAEQPLCLLEEDVPWLDGVDSTEPPFRDRAGLITYCINKLSAQRRTQFYAMIAKNEAAIEGNRSECNQNIKEALFTYALVSLRKNKKLCIGQAMAQASHRIRGGLPPSHKKDFLNRFALNDAKMIYALDCVFGNGMRELKRRASQLAGDGRTTPEGRHATYWLLRLMKRQKTDRHRAISFLNRDNPVPCPFGKKWDFMNAFQMLGEKTTTQGLLEQLAVNEGRNKRTSQQLFMRANNGDKTALEGYIRYFYEKKRYHHSVIAMYLRKRVLIPGFTNDTNWQAHMVYQYLHDLPITPDPPEDYMDVSFDARHQDYSSLIDPEITSSSAATMAPGHETPVCSQPMPGSPGGLDDSSSSSESSEDDMASLLTIRKRLRARPRQTTMKFAKQEVTSAGKP